MSYSKYFTLNLSRDTTKQSIPAYVLLLTLISYFQITVQIYQQMGGGGQYGKAPLAVPETSLCNFIANETVVYPSMRKASNLPATCPFNKVTMPLVKALEALGNSIIKWCVRSSELLRNHHFRRKNTLCGNISKLIQNKNAQNQAETHLPLNTMKGLIL